MKITTPKSLSALIVTAAAAFCLSATSVRAENPFPYLEQSLTRVISMAMAVDRGDVDLAPGNSLVGALLASGETITYNTPVRAGVRYVILAAGDQDVTDLDLTVKDRAGRLLFQDLQTDANPLVEFTAADDGMVRIEMRNVESRREGFCSLLILQKAYAGGLSTSSLAQALDNAMNLSRSASLYSTRFAHGTFCLFGGRVDQGATAYIYNMQPASGSYLVLSAGSNNLLDVDNWVIRQNNLGDPIGFQIAQDSTTDRVAVTAFDATYGNNYRLEHKNYSSRNGSSGFVFSVLLEQ